ncbi:hypothetical protein Tco_0717031 [Tanacetum coccineum]
METKNTSSSCSDSKEQKMQQKQKRAKNFFGYPIHISFQYEFGRFCSEEFSTFKSTFFYNMDNLEKLLNKELLHEKDSKNEIITSGKESSTLEKESNTSGNKSSMLGNEYNERSNFGNDTDIKPTYDTEPIAEVPYIADYDVLAIEKQHIEQPKFINDTYVMEKNDSNVTSNSSDMSHNVRKVD